MVHDSRLTSKTVPVLYSLVFFLPRYTLPDFPSISSLVSLSFLSCCRRTTWSAFPLVPIVEYFGKASPARKSEVIPGVIYQLLRAITGISEVIPVIASESVCTCNDRTETEFKISVDVLCLIKRCSRNAIVTLMTTVINKFPVG